MMNLLFSMLGPRLTPDQSRAFANLAHWTVLNERNGRLLVDGVGSAENVEVVLGMLTQYGRAPVAIGGWAFDGERVIPLDEAAWLAVAPDEYDITDPENPVPKRPVAFREIHQWAGWAAKQ